MVDHARLSAQAENKLFRERVLAFEDDLQASLEQLPKVKEKIIELNKSRKQWIHSAAEVDAVEADIFSKTLLLYRKQAEVLGMRIETSEESLHTVYEDQQLSALIAATKPYDDDETDQMRGLTLKKIYSDGAGAVEETLERAVADRSNCCNMASSVLRQVDLLEAEYKKKKELRRNAIELRMQEYIGQLEKVLEDGREKHRDLTREYLVLRHNARLVKEVVVRNENKLTKYREEMSENFTILEKQIEKEMQFLERSNAAELSALTNQLRQSLLSKEGDLEVLRSQVYRKRREDKESRVHTRILLKKYARKYNVLQEERKEDIAEQQAELARMRTLASNLELLAVQKTHGAGNDSTEVDENARNAVGPTLTQRLTKDEMQLRMVQARLEELKKLALS
jgi:hypothetical protein